MKNLLFTILSVLSFAFVISAQQSTKLDPTKLVSTWKVDLRPTPDAPAYFQTFEIKKIEGDTFSGTFYGAEIKNGRINQAWDVIYIAFTSSDNSGLYSHFAKLVGTGLEGTTHSLGRNFLMPWRAEKETQTQTKPKAVSYKKSKAAKNKRRV
jgi:hypothetical protein